MGQITNYLQARRGQGALRELYPLIRLGNGRVKAADGSGPEMVDFSSNDYLGLSEHPVVIKGAQQALLLGAGSGAARLMSGDLTIHHRLEETVARLKNKEAALLFGSGYLANIGVIPALAGRGDVIFCDRLNHASIYDGCKLSGARVIRFHHNDTGHLRQLLTSKRQDFNRSLVVVESIYSMDGDRCPLQEIAEISRQHNCQLMVDEAHATGLFGKNGGGIIEEEGVSDLVDIAMGTFGKALGSYGAYIAASEELIHYLINRARSFIYATALPPAVIGASLAAVDLVQKDDSLRRELFDKVNFFKKCLNDNGLNDDLGPSQIVPIVVGESDTAMKIAENLRQQGVYATAVRPPTVPEGTARLRFSITRHHTEADLEKTARLAAEQIRTHRPDSSAK
jgi:glycine C-acetyltransferase/8-amino-7-oxononanoate synthase